MHIAKETDKSFRNYFQCVSEGNLNLSAKSSVLGNEKDIIYKIQSFKGN